MNYDVNFFINKFEAIPEKLWCVNTREKNGARCALGWCYLTPKEAKLSERYSYPDSEEDKALCTLVNSHFKTMMPAGINNGVYPQYQQPTPKQRILAALRDIKALEDQQTRKDATTHILSLPMPVENTLDVKNVTIPC